MQILSANLLTTFEINMIDDDGNSKSVIVFYDNDQKKVMPIGQIDAEIKNKIGEFIGGYYETPINTVSFEIPDYIKENIKNAQMGNMEFFGITKEIKEYQNTNEPKDKK